MSCTNCGTSSPYITYNVQYSTAPCISDVACAGGYYNGKCVYYAGPNLACSGVNTKDSLEVALQKMDAQICTAIGNYSTYDFHCLSIPAPITTERQFVDVIATYVCATQTQLAAHVNSVFPAYQATVASEFGAIMSPSITCSIAGVSPSDSLTQILTKYCTALTALNTATSLTGVTWSACFTASTPSTIAGAFSLLADQICQVKALTSGGLPVFNNTGTCLPSPGATDSLVSTVGKIITRLCTTTVFDINALTWGCTTKPSSTTADLQSAFQTVLDTTNDYKRNKVTFSNDFVVTQTNSGNPCLGISVALATSLNQDRFVAATSGDTSPGALNAKLLAGANIALDYSTTPGKVIINTISLASISTTNSTSLSFTGNGTSGTPLIGTVKVSATAGNSLTTNSDGLYAAATAPSIYTFVETSTIKPTVVANAVSLAVKIDTNQAGNILTFSTNGLYCPAPNINPTTVIGGSTATLHLVATAGSGNSYTITGNPVISPTAAGQILTAITDGLAVRVSQTVGNSVIINSDGIYVAAAGGVTSTGTTNYHAKFTSSNSIGNSLIFDDGSKVTVNGVTGPSKFNVVGTAHVDLTETYASGPSYGFGVTYIPTYSGTLPASNTSFSSIPVEFHPIMNGSTTVAATTQFGILLASHFTKFSSTGTLSLLGGNASAGIHVGILDDGTINGTVDRSAGVVINGIALAQSASAVITRTNHYQLLINDTNQFSTGGNITNKFAIYQAGSNDVSRFFGPVQNASSSVQFTSDVRVKENFEMFTKGLAAIDEMTVKSFEYTYNKGKRTI